MNYGIPRGYCCVSYEDYDYFVSILAQEGRGSYIAEAYIESAFRIIQISPLDYHLLDVMVNGQYFYDRCLPWIDPYHVRCLKGLALPFSGYYGYYRKHSKCRQCRIYWMISFFLSHSESECCCYLHKPVADFVGIPVKHSTTVQPATCVTVHGIEVDTNMMQARLPQDKLDNAIALLRSFSRRKKVTLRQLQSLIGV